MIGQTRTADLRLRPVAHLPAAPVVAAIGLVAAIPLFFDYVPDASPAFALWGLTLAALGWLLCGLAAPAVVGRCRRLFVVAFVVRIVVVALLVHYDFWQDDELLYHSQAQQLDFFALLQDPTALWDLGVLRYAVICQAIYRLLGEDTIGPRLFNAWLGSLIGVGVYLLARGREERPWAIRAGWLATLYPDLVLYSGFQMKDIGVALGVTAFLLAIVRRANGTRSVANALLLAASVGCVAFLRFFVVVPMAMGLWWVLLEGRRGRARRAVLVAAAFVVLDVALQFAVPGASILQQLFGTMGSLHSSMFGIGSADDRSFFTGFAVGYTPVSIAVGFAYNLLVPFLVWPFTADGTIYKLLAPGIFAWYALMPFVARGAFHLDEKGAGPVFAVVVTTLLSLTLGGAFQAAGRHRVMVLPVLLLYAARGLDDFGRRDRWARRLVVMYGIGLAAGLGYYCTAKWS